MTRNEILNQLKEYNDKIEALLQERLEFMDSHMDDVSEFHIGDEYVNILTYEEVVVKELYRESSVGIGAGHYKDNSLYTICARFSNGDNTSRYGVFHPYCNKKDFLEKNEKYLFQLENCCCSRNRF